TAVKVDALLGDGGGVASGVDGGLPAGTGLVEAGGVGVEPPTTLTVTF
ncbi:hypothetical protein Tco_0716416, partial [Tanacetum coccineum]